MGGKKKLKLAETIFATEHAELRQERRQEDNVDVTVANEELRRCYDILMHLMENPTVGAFLNPVDWQTLDLPTYPQIVKNPMDLNQVKQRLLTRQIPHPTKFAELVRLVFKNASKFNQAGSDIHNYAQALLEEFEGNFEYVKLEKSTASQYYTPPVQHLGIPAGSGMDIDSAPAAVPNPKHLELEATIASLESKLSEVQNEIIRVKSEQEEQAKSKAADKFAPNRISSFRFTPPRRPLNYEQKAELCNAISEWQATNPSALEELLRLLGHKDSDVAELDIGLWDDDTLFMVQALVKKQNARTARLLKQRASGGGSDDDDYLDSRKRKK